MPIGTENSKIYPCDCVTPDEDYSYGKGTQAEGY